MHTLKVQPLFYDYITTGTKRIELRLLDEKRKNIHLKDTIRITKEPENIEYTDVVVTGLLNYKDFSGLLNDFDISMLSDKTYSKVSLLNELEKFYPIEEQQQYSVVGIRFELL